MHIGKGILAAGLAAGLALGASTAEGAEVIAQWDFNDLDNQFEPSIGAGVLDNVNTSWGSPADDGSPNDPGVPNNRNRLSSWNMGDPIPDKSRGWQISVDTSGMSDIVVWWDTAYSSSSLSRYWTVQYSIDGENFIDYDLIEREIGSSSGSTWVTHIYDLSEVAGVSDNSDFAFRVMSTMKPGTNEFEGISGSVTTSSGAQLYLDLITVQGVPEPASLALVGAGGMMLLLRRRSASTK
ncbi:PEP-CTERM sorting domain-containing protein [Phycisphaerales bacterium AB-hyl4]|uniref:PEP-CTERM sorting domain-containing protein n=1 Tax=Natronomicrosphaera hydrolytica TaxID=3242702 RepID=A0ABV4U3D5_9BACT